MSTEDDGMDDWAAAMAEQAEAEEEEGSGSEDADLLGAPVSYTHLRAHETV